MRGRLAPSSRRSTGPSPPCGSLSPAGEPPAVEINGKRAATARLLAALGHQVQPWDWPATDEATAAATPFWVSEIASMMVARRSDRPPAAEGRAGTLGHRGGAELPSAWLGQSRRSTCCSPPSPARLSGLAMPVRCRSRLRKAAWRLSLGSVEEHPCRAAAAGRGDASQPDRFLPGSWLGGGRLQRTCQ